MKLWLDLETFNETPIKHGTHAYAETVEIMLVAWAVDDNPSKVWDVTAGQYCLEFFEAFRDADEICAHNSHFDRTMLAHAWGAVRPIEVWRDTMVQALTHSLPAGLGDLCDVLKLPTDAAKDKDGKRLVNLFCKPLPKNWKSRRATRETHPADWARFVEYARLDVEAMRECARRMPTWNYTGAELALWHLDQRINDRGVLIDTALVDAALATVESEKKRLSAQAHEMTDGAVANATQRAALGDYIANQYGYPLENLQASTIERALGDENMPAELRALLSVRLAATTSSTAKYKTLANGVSADGRLRGILQFAGASRTARWAGRLFQPQNLKRSSMNRALIDVAIEGIKDGTVGLIW